MRWVHEERKELHEARFDGVNKNDHENVAPVYFTVVACIEKQEVSVQEDMTYRG